MSKYKICVYAICKNEEKFVDGWMNSMSEADLVVVTDTGSTDDTVEKLQKRGAVIYSEDIKPWRFDTARNRSLAHVPDNIDICVCTDLDESFNAGWRDRLENAWQPDTHSGRYLYNWSLKPDGSPDVQFTYFKVHARRNFVWRYPIHECLMYTGGASQNIVFIDDMILNHYPDPSKSRGSYLPLLELAVEENPQDDRMTYYLGREYMYAGQYHKCIETLQKYLLLPAALWNEERCAAMRCMAESCYKLNNVVGSKSWYYRAIAEAHYLRDAYVECAKMGYETSDWPLTFYMAQEALKIKERSGTYINMGYSWDYTPHDLAAISAYQLQLYDISLEHAKTALDYAPTDERLKNNVLLIEQKCHEWNQEMSHSKNENKQVNE